MSVHSLSEILRCNGRRHGPNGIGTQERKKRKKEISQPRTLYLLKEEGLTARTCGKKVKGIRKKLENKKGKGGGNDNKN